jgi:hypothetical protein
LGIGDWAQSPIPNPQSPIPNPHNYPLFYFILFNIIKSIIIKISKINKKYLWGVAKKENMKN